MRFSTAAIVASLAVGHAVAGPTPHLRHMQMHAAREAEAAPEAEPQDWSKVHYDLSGVNWSTVDFSGGKTAAATTAAAAAPTAPAAQPTSQPQTQQQQQQQQQPSSHEGSATSSAQSSQPTTSTTGGSSPGNVAGLVSQLTSNPMGLSIKPVTSSGQIQVGQPGTYTINAKNNKHEPMLLVFWDSNTGYTSSFVGMGVEAPAMVVPIAARGSEIISVASGMSGACAPVWASTPPTDKGQIRNTWLEFTMTPGGVVDVSREVFMGGDSIATQVQSTGCKSNMSQCSFQCLGGAQTCETGYQLMNCGGQTGAIDGGVNGGCGWANANGATIDATFG